MEKQRDSTELSAIICAYDEHELTVEHIKGCMRSTRIPDEIIVVNDGGDPSLRDMIEKIDKKCPVIYARISEDIPWNIMGSRNLGVWLSRGKYLAIEDNDHIPEERFYEDAIGVLNEGNLDLMRSSKRWVIVKEDLKKDELPKTQKRGQHKFSGIYTRDLFIRMKGCDERMRGCYGPELTDWQKRLARLGARIGKLGFYYLVEDGYTKSLARGHDGKNFILQKGSKKFLNDNAINERSQNAFGIINFNYEYERFEKTI